tara:strand:- start:58 stop:483 length:426 start_codon:yes stop_codon:yes gene_type:complete
MAHQIPEEVIELILSFAPDYHDNLLSCHKEMLTEHRPMYYKKVSVGFTPGIADSRDWNNFKRNEEIRLYKPPGVVFMKLKLYAIEITPEIEVYGGEEEQGQWRHSRHMNLYYGWTKGSSDIFRRTLSEWNQYQNDLCPGYY